MFSSFFSSFFCCGRNRRCKTSPPAGLLACVLPRILYKRYISVWYHVCSAAVMATGKLAAYASFPSVSHAPHLFFFFSFFLLVANGQETVGDIHVYPPRCALISFFFFPACNLRVVVLLLRCFFPLTSRTYGIPPTLHRNLRVVWSKHLGYVTKRETSPARKKAT